MSGVWPLLDYLDRMQRRLTSLFFFVTLVVVAFQVFNRFLFQLPVLWTSELSVFCFIWLALLSASSSVRSNGHFRVTALIDASRLQGRPRYVLEIISILAIIALFSILLVYGTNFMLAGVNEQSPGLAFSMAWPYSAVPICSATALAFAAERLWHLLKVGHVEATTSESEGEL